MKTRRSSDPPTAESVLAQLEAACSRQEMSSADARERMRRRGLEPTDIESVITRLIERRFIDDERFARAYVRDRYRLARWGRLKIQMGLRAKRIAVEVIREAMLEIDDEEYEEILTSLLRAKVRAARLTRSYPDRVKLMRFAASRGYETSIISKIINSAIPWTDDDLATGSAD